MNFKNRIYTYERTVTTQVTDQYVPDWGLFEALRESVQNMVDEVKMTGVGMHWEGEGGRAYFYDQGSGVSFDNILYLGASGKRGVEGVVGQHGEGEVVSFLAAARLGIDKVMVSQDWLAKGKIVQVDGHRVLAIDVYKTGRPRKGTAWQYIGEDVFKTFMKALKVFRPPNRRGRRKHLLHYGNGQLLTNGMKVNRIDGLTFGYDLKMTPGRDRGGFTLEQIKPEIIGYLNKASVEEVQKLLDAMKNPWWMPEEGKLELDIPLHVARAAAKRIHPKLCWTVRGQEPAAVADASSQHVPFITFGGDVPNWISRTLPHIKEALGSKREIVSKKLPNVLNSVVEKLRQVLPEKFSSWTCKAVYKFEDSKTIAVSGSGEITLSRSHIKGSSWETFLGTMAHEIAHIYTLSPDCTRRHAAGIEAVMASLISAAMEDSKLLKEAKKEYDWYAGGYCSKVNCN